MITVGIDVGSITAKAAIMVDGQLCGTCVLWTGFNAQSAADMVFEKVLDDSGHDKGLVDRIVSTGYGRNRVAIADRAVTEITCHAAGAHFLDPKIRSVIDIGGQDSKAIVMDAKGKVLDFAMNDKCAAGTGRFLEVMARALEVDLEHFGKISLESDAPSTISSMCTVFAESEVISLISKGEGRENIVAGIHESIGSRISAMAGRLKIKAPVMMTGGVAKNSGLVKTLENRIGMPITVSSKAQVTGAIGAALLAINN